MPDDHLHPPPPILSTNELLPTSVDQLLVETWDGEHVTAANPNFDFEALLLAAIERKDILTDPTSDPENLFSLSPLTSPESTPPSSPRISPALVLSLEAGASALETLAPELVGSSSNKPKGRKQRRQANKYATRQKKRQQAQEDFHRTRSRENIKRRYINDSQAIDCDVVLEGSSVTSTGYTGLDDKSRPTKVFRLDEVTGDRSSYRFRLVKWNGRDPMPVRDTKGRIVAVLAGHPNNATWPRLATQAAHALEERRRRVNVPKNKAIHRRGTFAALATGVSHGQGQTHPSNLSHKGENARVLQELNGMEPFKIFARFSSSVMEDWAPDLHAHYVKTLGKLYRKDPTLKRIFPSSVFTDATYNFGPRTECFKHTDFANLPFGWCSVTALGSYDPTKGGHLILWECYLVIKFPPGSTILLSSAIIAHSNTAVSTHETRYSFALYTAGALFRWVANDHKKATVYLELLSAEEKLEVKAKNRVRFERGLSLLPTLKKAGCEAA